MVKSEVLVSGRSTVLLSLLSCIWCFSLAVEECWGWNLNLSFLTLLQDPLQWTFVPQPPEWWCLVQERVHFQKHSLAIQCLWSFKWGDADTVQPVRWALLGYIANMGSRITGHLRADQSLASAGAALPVLAPADQCCVRGMTLSALLQRAARSYPTCKAELLSGRYWEQGEVQSPSHEEEQSQAAVCAGVWPFGRQKKGAGVLVDIKLNMSWQMSPCGREVKLCAGLH